MKKLMAAIMLVASAVGANAQQVMDGSDKAFNEPVAADIVASLVGKTPDPYSVQIIRLRTPADNAPGDLCGMLNLKNQNGGYTGFQPFMISAGVLFLQSTNQCR